MEHRPPVSTPEDAVAAMLPVVAQRPAGLFSDFDGTLSPLAPSPDLAVMHQVAREALIRLVPLLDEVGVITGRAAETAEAMVGIPGIDYVGNHGLEWRRNGQHVEHPGSVASAGDVAAAMREIARRVAGTPADDGLRFEDKRLSGSIHYREADHPERVREPLLAVAGEVAEAHGLRITEGRKIVEVRPKLVVNKGTALQRLIKERALRGVLFFGDDVTDVDGFHMLRAMRQDGCSTLAVAVASPEAPAAIYDQSDVILASVDDCARTLQLLADALTASPAGEGLSRG